MSRKYKLQLASDRYDLSDDELDKLEEEERVQWKQLIVEAEKLLKSTWREYVDESEHMLSYGEMLENSGNSPVAVLHDFLLYADVATDVEDPFTV